MTLEKGQTPAEGKAPSRKTERRNPFNCERYKSRADHIGRMEPYEFVATPADETFARITKDRPELQKPFNMSYGDPAAYPGLEAYHGLVRFIRRFINFENPSVYSRYAFRGDPQMIEQLRIATSDADKNYSVPEHTIVYLTPGVAGGLRLIVPGIVLHPRSNEEIDNVIVPKWTYLSHMAEVILAKGEVRTCNLNRDGQMDLNHLEKLIDHNTRAVMLATVGNPLAIAIEHKRYDDMLRIIHSKMEEFKHPISVIADVIYEHFRHSCNGERLDPIQKALRLFRSERVDVPVWEVSSFSKMFAMAGQRFGYARGMMTSHDDLAMATFSTELADMLKAVELLYGTSLNQVPSILQKPVGKLYSSIRRRLPQEEVLAPIAAVLTSIKELTDMEGGGDSHTFLPEAVPDEMIRMLDIDPGVYFSTSAIAKRTRKLAKEELGGFKVDIVTKRVESIGEQLVAAGIIDTKEIEIEKSRMDGILLAAVAKHCNAEMKVLAGVKRGHIRAGISANPEQQKIVAEDVMAELMKIGSEEAKKAVNEFSELEEDFGLSEFASGQGSDKIRLTFYKLKETFDLPELERRENGQLRLYKISEEVPWINFTRDFNRRIGNDKSHLRIPTEDDLHESFKIQRRKTVHKRVQTFLHTIEEMRKKGLGVYLHPSYYDEDGNLVPERVNSFYILFGIEKLRDSKCQAAELILACVANDVKITKATPGEIFLAPEVHDEDSSYIRAVPLLDVDGQEKIMTEQQMAEMLKALEAVLIAIGPNGGPKSGRDHSSEDETLAA